MSTRDKTKKVVGFLAGAGVGGALSNLLREKRNHSDNKLVDTYHDSASLVGCAVAGMAAGDAIRPHSDKVVDSVFDLFERITFTAEKH